MAQKAWKQYSWDAYNVEFELPEDFVVTTNTADALEAEGEGIRFALYPFDDKELEEKDLAGFIVDMAERDLNLSEIDEMEVIEVDGMTGGFVSGQKDGLMYLVLGLIDTVNSNNFYAFVAFEEEQEDVIEDAITLFESFGKID
ncbi:hypothetical protein BFP72_01895 [Reichenbachiella sp. 5M10]|nr:hypothetical protein BFP72_01895 [Reichenbachiella sp. 5M10]